MKVFLAIKSLKDLFDRKKQILAKDEGFSLIELMVVLVIMGLLTSIVVVVALPGQDKALITKANADIRTISQAVDLYRMDTLRYPSTEDGLEVLLTAPKAASYRTEGYIRSMPLDPWGNPYYYLYPGEKSTFDVFSLGADGRRGGEGLNQDIGNWQ
ncbi:type II secretion system major pseudopilin GspG [Kordiimonas aquimaris]|uniref:type II secretion system major pseudopilin GspG n=1 Tax=Kordiimonas aquimaris TaxID=707591 RepID=UPI0021CEF1E7|nr:type II secretion system major pseudopilin GspG [Kordiimonas aquimaris]